MTEKIADWKPILKKVFVSLLIALVLMVSGQILYWKQLYRQVSHFSICSDLPVDVADAGTGREGVPYWMWLVLPRLFPEYLPASGGYTSLGIDWEPGAELPVGFSKRAIGFPYDATTFLQCSGDPDSEEEIPPPSQRFDLEAYRDFFRKVAGDYRFTADYILDSNSNGISFVYDLSWLDKKVYRTIIVPAARQMFLSDQ